MLHGFRIRQEHRDRLRATLFVVCLSYAASLASAQPGQARDLNSARLDATALLQSSKPLRIGVVGDSIAGDLGDGMQRLLRDRDNLEIVKFAKPATGLMRDDVYNWQRALKGFLQKTKLDVIAVTIGGNDRQSIWMNGRRLSRGSAAWLAEYERRVARFMKLLATADAKVYWVGLPIVHSERMSRDYRRLNQIFHAQARKHGFGYVSTWERFAGENGDYSSFGRNLEGVKRRLRKEDGLHFTIDGELLLAHTVANAIGRDLREIKAAR